MTTTVNPSGVPVEQPLNRWFTRAYAINWEVVVYVAIFLIAILTRFAGLGDRVMSHDESLHTYYSYRLYAFGEFNHTPLMHGPILFHATALFYFLFGDNDYTARLYPAILGVIMVMFPLLFRRWLGRWGSILASVMILISPLLLYHHRYIREDTPAIMATLIMVYCTLMYLDGPMHLRRKARWLYIFSAALLWNLGSKETAFMYIAIFGSFLTIYWLVRLLQHFRGIPGRTVFYSIMLPLMIAGVAALAMYAVISIALSIYPTLEERLRYLAEQAPNLLGSAPLEFTTFVTWTLVLVVLVAALVIGTALWAFRTGRVHLSLREIIILLVLIAVFSIILIGIEELSHVSARLETASPAVPGDATEAVAVAATTRLTPIIGAWVLAIVVVGAMIYSRAAGWWRTLHRFAELDILIVFGVLTLPWLTPFVIKLTGASATDYSSEGIIRAVFSLIPMFIISFAVGFAWNWKRILISSAIFWALFVFFFTTMFTNPDGLATGVIGSLGYWLEQQDDRRGSQPQYYYTLIVMPFYEFLPMFGSFLAMLAGMLGFWRFRRARLAEEQGVPDDDSAPSLAEVMGETSVDEAIEQQVEVEKAKVKRRLRSSPEYLKRVPFTLFVGYWAIYIVIFLTLAGEKMPWLVTHITVPMILLSAWYFGRIFDTVRWQTFRERGWILLLLLPLLFIAGFQTVVPFLVGQSPFAGLQQQQLGQLNFWLAMVALVILLVAIIYWIGQQVGWRHLRHMIALAIFIGLGLLTFRSAWGASFINYDYANEFLVYAHAAPGVKRMMEQIEELSRRTSDGLNMRFAWGGNAWPVTWYFRDLKNAVFFGGNPTFQLLDGAVAVYASGDIRARVEPLLEDRYYRYEYIRMWWPMQDYFNLTPQRVINAFDLNPTNTQASQIRRGIFDIWWSRDYTRYGEAVGGDYSLKNWPVSERLYFYVRKDIAAQIWDLGVGDGTALVTTDTAAANVCTTNWQQRYADFIYSQTRLNHPIDVQVAPDGRLYVAEEFGNRVSIFDQNGNLIGGLGDVIGLNRPNGLAIASDGTLYVADTWNYRIQRFGPDGSLLTGWGQPGQYGIEAQIEPVDGFWGPRDVAVDSAGNVYVADTGNKRVRVYSPDGVYIRDIGSGGSMAGQLDEPSGLAISPDGRLYVADTWNKRVSVFALDGTPLFNFPVRGWYEDQGNRPYLAVDGARNLVYVTDPNAGRVLVYDLQGNCIGSFGQPTDQAFDGSQFQVVSGITLDSAGNVYVADAAAGRVLRFAPFVDSFSGANSDPSGQNSAVEQIVAEEVTSQVDSPLLPDEGVLGGDSGQ